MELKFVHFTVKFDDAQTVGALEVCEVVMPLGRAHSRHNERSRAKAQDLQLDQPILESTVKENFVVEAREFFNSLDKKHLKLSTRSLIEVMEHMEGVLGISVFLPAWHQLLRAD